MRLANRRSTGISSVLLLLFLAAAPALASTPANLAGRLDTGLQPYGGMCAPSFQWYDYFGVRPLAPDDDLVLDFAVIPFQTGLTVVGLDMEDGPTILELDFENGMVNELPYDPAGWNDVKVEIHPGAEDYLLTVNGAQAGPYPLSLSCSTYGGCDSVQAFRAHSFYSPDSATAWFDEVTIVRRSAGGDETLYTETFDTGRVFTTDNVIPGTLVSSVPPAGLLAGGSGANSCDSPRPLLSEIQQDLSAPGTPRVVSGSYLKKLRGAVQSMGQAERKTSQTLESLVATLQAKPGMVTTSMADSLIASSRDVLAALGTPAARSSFSAGSTSSVLSAPAGLAGKISTGLDGQCLPRLDWYEYFDVHPLDAGDELVLEFAVIPFRTGLTLVSLDMDDGPTFFGLVFENGLIDGLAYDPDGWNDVRAEIRGATQDYILTVNGVEAPPHPLAEECPQYGGCNSVQSISVDSFDSGAQTEGWIDEISLVRVSGGASETLFQATFDDGATYMGSPGTIVASPPPSSASAASGACSPVREQIGSLAQTLSDPTVPQALRAMFADRLRGAAKAMTDADQKSLRLLGDLIPLVEAQSGAAITPQKADELIAMIREAMGYLD